MAYGVTCFLIIWFKRFALWVYLIFVLSMKFLLVFCAFFYTYFISGQNFHFPSINDLANQLNSNNNFIIFQFFLILVSTLAGIGCGFYIFNDKYVNHLRAYYYGLFFGVSKVLWFFILIFSVYIVMSFLIDLSFTTAVPL